jgi:hypothetical protein
MSMMSEVVVAEKLLELIHDKIITARLMADRDDAKDVFLSLCVDLSHALSFLKDGAAQVEFNTYIINMIFSLHSRGTCADYAPKTPLNRDDHKNLMYALGLVRIIFDTETTPNNARFANRARLLFHLLRAISDHWARARLQMFLRNTKCSNPGVNLNNVSDVLILMQDEHDCNRFWVDDDDPQSFCAFMRTTISRL